MKATATQLRRMEDPVSIPDGTYSGLWGGYLVTFMAQGVSYEAQTDIGIRTLQAKCAVIVKDGKITVQL